MVGCKLQDSRFADADGKRGMNGMLRQRLWWVFLTAACLTQSACTQSMHGSFTAHSYRAESGQTAVQLGPVEGRSCQTRALYTLPQGDRASTDRAMQDAMSKRDGTLYLANISVDDEMYFGIGYSRRCIVVAALAYGVGD